MAWRAGTSLRAQTPSATRLRLPTMMSSARSRSAHEIGASAGRKRIKWRKPMDKQFDELSKSLAEGISRREALRKFGIGLAGVVLAAVGLATRAEACSTTSCGHGAQDPHCCPGFKCHTFLADPLNGPRYGHVHYCVPD